MSNDIQETDVYKRLFNLNTAIGKLIMDKKRDPHVVADHLQSILDYPTRFNAGLLEYICTITIPATDVEFVAKNKFVRNVERGAPVRISLIDRSFEIQFLQGKGKIENAMGEHTLGCDRLCQDATGRSILGNLGYEVKAETTLSDLFFLIKNQKYGEDGILLNDGKKNIFYIRDSYNYLCMVVAIYSGGWQIGANPIDPPERLYRGLYKWRAGAQVFSNNAF